MCGCAAIAAAAYCPTAKCTTLRGYRTRSAAITGVVSNTSPRQQGFTTRMRQGSAGSAGGRCRRLLTARRIKNTNVSRRSRRGRAVAERTISGWGSLICS